MASVVQAIIDYEFADDQLLHSALQAAHRTEEGQSDDGNRGLSRFGLCAMDMVEAFHVIVVGNGTKRDVDTCDHWFQNKKHRATACKELGIDCYVARSVRQQHEQPSTTVLANALSAIVGAVWLDLQRRNESAAKTIEQIFAILRRMETCIADKTGSRFSATDEGRSVLSEGNHGAQMNIPREAQHFATPVEILDQTVNSLDVIMPPSFEQNDTTLCIDPPWLSFDGTQAQFNSAPFGEASAQDISFVGFNLGPIESTYDSIGLSEPNGAVEHQEQRIQSTFAAMNDARQGSFNIVENPQTAVASRKRRHSSDHEIRPYGTSLHERLVQAELDKLESFPAYARNDLEALLDHPKIGELSQDASQVLRLRLLYFTIGGCQSLLGFKRTLDTVRSRPTISSAVLGPNLCPTERFKEICRLDDQEALCILLRRYHVIQLFETEQASIFQSNRMIVDTPSTFRLGHTATMGNPAERVKADLTDVVLGKIRPDLEKGTEEFRRIRAQISQLRRLAKVLQIWTETYGCGILALLPTGAAYSEFNLTDSMLLSLTEKRLRPLSNMVYQNQGQVLKELSKAVEPALTALVNGDLSSSTPFPIEYTEPGVFERLPKGSQQIFEYLHGG